MEKVTSLGLSEVLKSLTSDPLNSFEGLDTRELAALRVLEGDLVGGLD